MEMISKLMDHLQQPTTIRSLLIAGSGWLILNLLCWGVGAAGLLSLGQKLQIKSCLPACLPGGQIWYTLKLAGHERAALWAEHLLWWCPALTVGAGAAVIWAAAEYLDRGGSLVFWLLGAAAVLLLASAAIYVALRVLEFRALLPIFRCYPAWILSLIGTLFCVPLQRLLLFFGRKAYLSKEEE